VQRVKAKRACLLLRKPLSFFDKLRHKVSQQPLHLGNPGSGLDADQSLFPAQVELLSAAVV